MNSCMMSGPTRDWSPHRVASEGLRRLKPRAPACLEMREQLGLLATALPVALLYYLRTQSGRQSFPSRRLGRYTWRRGWETREILGPGHNRAKAAALGYSGIVQLLSGLAPQLAGVVPRPTSRADRVSPQHDSLVCPGCTGILPLSFFGLPPRTSAQSYTVAPNGKRVVIVHAF